MSQHRLDDIDETRDIDPIVGKRLRYRFSDVSQSGKMDDGARSMTLECRVQRRRIENVASHERTPPNEFGVPFRQVVERDRQEAVSGQGFAGVTADEAGAAGDEDCFHRAHVLLLRSPWG
jgi:hypothetical protein